jgi:hypothetical protein
MTNKSRKWWKDAEMITALSAVFIGVVALIIGAYQAKVSSDQRAASVWPYLEVSRYIIQGEQYGFTMINKGVGPALIKQMEVLVDGKPMKGWSTAIRTMINEDINIKSIYSSTNKSVIAVQESRKMVDVKDKQTIQKIQAADDNIAIKVCYCSIFKDCWIAGRG